ncbi:hypothetical protein KMW28_14925 [Flammeovirga yaeyamensis]|uniref:Lipoprotein n=1 Tax=Flammeovirga yaeyamensis TaxID=367791 RepID=A0AAX1N0D9_9BACT|nr:hypothetical protein [Flammeovirga yaeyamensis]MBB3700112.1 hypothetical protein [Flammeovirga yaeyamensis]NMF37257.1 hypothetical protein [Flammeovirga yaeyamensis]QWG00945.1 hypothetical protein KMW28_14925 [Flammeovirga yaeyamensis]
MNKKHLILLSFIFLIFSCEQKTTQKEETETTEYEEYSLEKDVDINTLNSNDLHSELDSLLNEAMASENLKINFSKQIMDDLVLSGVTIKPKIRKDLEKAIVEVENLKYNEISLGDNDKMMAYDKAVQNLLDALKSLEESVGGFEKYPRPAMLVESIDNSSTRDIFTRGYYNGAAQQWNYLIKDYADKVKKEMPEASLQPVPYFYGEEPI